MKLTLLFILSLLLGILPVCAVYWFMFRVYLLAVARARVLRIFADLRAFAYQRPPGHPAQQEAHRGLASCMRLEREMARLDFGDVLAEAVESTPSLAPIASDPAISQDDAEKLKRFHERFCAATMAVVLINSPLWFPIIAMVEYGSRWSRWARKQVQRIHRGVRAVTEPSPNATDATPAWA